MTRSPRVLFVCIGNICRSPLAEAMARVKWGDQIDVESAGVASWRGNPSPEEALEVAREEGLDLSRHRSRHVEDLDLSLYDRIVAMTPGIASRLQHSWGVPNERMIVLEIPDPFGDDVSSYRRVYRLLEAELSSLRERIVPSI